MSIHAANEGFSVGAATARMDTNGHPSAQGTAKAAWALPSVCAIPLLPLESGLLALVDFEDFERLAGYDWQPTIKTKRVTYAFRFTTRDERARGASITEYMHRVILGLDCPEVDHRNGDGLDNRRENLRFATTTQNMANRRKRVDIACSSRFKGVSRRRTCVSRPWQAVLRDTYLGYFVTEEEAARAYDSAALQIYGEFARLNFPKEAR